MKMITFEAFFVSQKMKMNHPGRSKELVHLDCQRNDWNSRVSKDRVKTCSYYQEKRTVNGTLKHFDSLPQKQTRIKLSQPTKLHY